MQHPTIQNNLTQGVKMSTIKPFINLICAQQKLNPKILSQNTGANLFSLYNGITRYTTHDLAGGNIEDILYSNANKLNVMAMDTAMAMMN